MLSIIFATALAASDMGTTVETRNCLHATNIRTTKVMSDQVILFEMRDRSVWRNTLRHRCPQLGFHESFIYEVRGSQLCDTDIIRVLIPTGGLNTGASCGLDDFERMEGSFQDVRKAEKKRIAAEKAAAQK